MVTAEFSQGGFKLHFKSFTTADVGAWGRRFVQIGELYKDDPVSGARGVSCKMLILEAKFRVHMI